MLRTIKRYGRETAASVAVEFAFIAPILIALFFATVEVTEALDCRARITNAVSTAADLTAQKTQVSTADLDNVYAATQAILFPQDTTKIKLTVSSIKDNNSGGGGTVAWSYAKNGTPRATGSIVSLPSGLIVSGSGGSIILAEITYAYTSPSAEFLTGTITMTGKFYSRPRRSTVVTCSDC